MQIFLTNIVATMHIFWGNNVGWMQIFWGNIGCGMHIFWGNDAFEAGIGAPVGFGLALAGEG
jgi:hypothetical protein